MTFEPERTIAAYWLFRYILRKTGQSDVSLANRLAPVALAYWRANAPDPTVVQRAR